MDGPDFSLYELSGKPESSSRAVTNDDLFGVPSSSTRRPSSSSPSPPSPAKNGLTDSSDLKMDDEFGLHDLYNEDGGYTEEEEFRRKYGVPLSTNAPAEEIQGPPAPAEEMEIQGPPAPAEDDLGPAAPAEDDLGPAAPAEDDLGPAAPAEVDVEDMFGEVDVEFVFAELDVQAPDEVVVADPEEQGWTVVRSRRYGMIRGLHPDPEIPSPEAEVCLNELDWYAMSGPVRSKKKWARARQGAYGGTKGGIAVFIYPYPTELWVFVSLMIVLGL